jgi:hypothetical protein
MHKIILMLLLIVISNSAMAAWSKVTVNEEATIYADTSTMSKNGNTVKMWDIADFKKKAADSNYLSLKSQQEYDCKAKQKRTLAYSTFSGNMASGKLVNSNNFVRPWSPVHAGSIVAALWATACGKH